MNLSSYTGIFVCIGFVWSVLTILFIIVKIQNYIDILRSNPESNVYYYETTICVLSVFFSPIIIICMFIYIILLGCYRMIYGNVIHVSISNDVV